MDTRNRRLYLIEILESLYDTSSVMVFIEGELIHGDLGEEAVYWADYADALELRVLWDNRIEKTAKVPLNACKYFVKGQGNHFANTLKTEIAKDLFNLS